MHRITLYSILCTCVFNSAFATLSLSGYLEQVKSKHQGIQASKSSAEGSLQYSEESDLVTAPSFFANVNYLNDQKRGVLFPYTGFLQDTVSVGFAKNFSFGLQSKLYYAYTYTNYQGIGQPGFYQGTPTLELTQSLWKNGFGAQTRATANMAQAGALATHYGERFKIKSLILQSELSYWRLALSRELVSVRTEALQRSQKIFDWNQRRVNLQLADKSDQYQAQSGLEIRKLELQLAQDEERSACHTFNLNRGIAGDKVTEELVEIDDTIFSSVHIPERMARREDIEAAKQQQRMAEASAEIARQNDAPQFDVYGNVALNAVLSENSSTFSNAIAQSFQTNFPTLTLGLRFLMPLDIGAFSGARSGRMKDILAADLNYQRKVFEQEQEWKDLILKYSESKRKLELTRALEKVQKEKVSHEKDRFQKGRSTTNAVVIFEQDYAEAQFRRIQSQLEILQILAQLKLFSKS